MRVPPCRGDGSSMLTPASILTQPNMYARGILFGKMKYELGDHSFVRCPELGLTADIEFKTKGWVGGVYNAIGGVIRNENTGQILFELSGMWSDEMFIKDTKVLPTPLFLDIRDTDIFRRLAIRRCSSMHYARNRARHKCGRSRNRRSASHSDFGPKPHKQ